MKKLFIWLFSIISLNATCVNLVDKVGYEKSNVKVKYCDDNKYYFEIPNERVPYLEAILDKNEFNLLIQKLKEIVVQSSKVDEKNIPFEIKSTIKENIMAIKYHSSYSMLIMDIQRDYKSAPFALIGKENISNFTSELEKELNDSTNKLNILINMKK